MSRGGGKKPFTLEERKMIQKMISHKEDGGRIAVAINRSRTGINKEIRFNGGRDNYDAVKAHNEAIQREVERAQKLKKNKGVCRPRYMDRINNLEMQVKILFEAIEGLINK